MITTSAPLAITLYRGPENAGVQGDWWTTIISRLLGLGLLVKVVNNLDNLLTDDCKSVRKSVALGHFNGAVPQPYEGKIHDISGKSPDEVVAFVQSNPTESTATAGRPWKPWFPVIDFNRCTNCMQCLSFCLFDVYGVSKEGKIQVQNESNCKTDCPACSRVCPEVAIMFPKYKAGPINGDVVSSDDVRREAMKIDISALLGGDIFSMLRDRSERAKSRFSKERDDDRALRERQRCLEKLKGAMSDFDVPPEVLASLPSPDQIQFKAEQARKRAAEALERQAATSQPADSTASTSNSTRSE